MQEAIEDTWRSEEPNRWYRIDGGPRIYRPGPNGSDSFVGEATDRDNADAIIRQHNREHHYQ